MDNLAFERARMAFGCLYRCFCNYGLEELSVQPYKPPWFTQFLRKADDSSAIEMQIEADWMFYDQVLIRNYLLWDQYASTIIGVDSIWAFVGPQTALNTLYHRMPSTIFAVSMHPENAIECRESLPTFPVPAPFQMSDFRNLTQLCAVAWSGGKP